MQTVNTAAAAATKTTSGSTSGNPKSTLDYSAFLQLLVAELKNQDPTKPTESTQFVAQLASFSSVEQGVNTNAKLDALINSFALSQAGGMIGHTLTNADGSVSGKVTSVNITSSGAVAMLDNGKSIALGAGVTVS